MADSVFRGSTCLDSPLNEIEASGVISELKRRSRLACWVAPISGVSIPTARPRTPILALSLLLPTVRPKRLVSARARPILNEPSVTTLRRFTPPRRSKISAIYSFASSR